MNTVRYTLVTDGTSDQALLHILEWCWRTVLRIPAQGSWFDLRSFHGSEQPLERRIAQALALFPCEVLFVHRDAERESIDKRCREIRDATAAAIPPSGRIPYVCVIPVRMTEAWLLFDQDAIRRASGNPNGAMPLALPHMRRAERIPDPKSVLADAIRTASGLSGRHLRKLRVGRCRARLAELIEDFSPLRQLSAFARLEEDIRAVAVQLAEDPPTAVTRQESCGR